MNDTLTKASYVEEAERIIADVPWTPPVPELEEIVPVPYETRPLIQPYPYRPRRRIRIQPLLPDPTPLPARAEPRRQHSPAQEQAAYGNYNPVNAPASICTASRNAALTSYRPAPDPMVIPFTAVTGLGAIAMVALAALAGIPWQPAAGVIASVWAWFVVIHIVITSNG